MLKISFLLFTLALIACYGKSIPDIEKYKEFLLKSIGGKPTAPLNEDQERLQNEWERSGKFQGDILVTEEQVASLVASERNALGIRIGLWPNRTAYYHLNAEYFNTAQLAAIFDAIADINRLSCVRLVPKGDNTRIFINIQGKDEGCYAGVGFLQPFQTLNLEPDAPGSGCFKHGTIVHEFLHAIGFFHTQSTDIRDDYVEIVWENVQEGAELNFYKMPSFLVDNLDLGYDYGSVMHYSEYSFSVNGNRTIIPLRPTNDTIGQRNGMSEMDVIRLNKLYNCPGY